jgi:hypothetical protein
VPRVLRYATILAAAIAATFVLPLPAGANNGGGTGTGGGTIWAATWWDGNPQGPGPGSPPQSGGQAVCSWLDVGPTLGDMTSALATAGLPASFWPVSNSGYGPGAYQVIKWAIRIREAQGSKSEPGAHFDIVACPSPGMVPGMLGNAYTQLPTATPPSGQPEYIWIYWDIVPDPGSPGTFPEIGRAYQSVPLPALAIDTSPSTVDGIADASIVNFPTWLWLEPQAWQTVEATATGGGLTATVWATPVSATWTAGWDFTSPSQDPEQAVNQLPTALDLVCDGPGTPYSLAASPSSPSPTCGTTFTQSTFGTWTTLRAAVKWTVSWALTGTDGIVGGEGTLPPIVSTAGVPLRVVQIESVVSAA